MSLTIRQIAPTFGAEISGIDLTAPFSPAIEAELVGAIGTYGVCVYPDGGARRNRPAALHDRVRPHHLASAHQTSAARPEPPRRAGGTGQRIFPHEH